MENNTFTISFLINLIIFVVTMVLVAMFFREEGKFNLSRPKRAFRFFTTQSNVLCAIASLCMCFFPGEQWAYYLKIIGTAAVIVTMLTVIFFLGPIYGYLAMYKGADLFMHLLTPLMAIVSLFFFERRGIGFLTSFIGMLPVALYAPLYLYKVVLTMQWDDFYQFNVDGKWKRSYAMMLAGSAVICVVMWWGLNL